MPVNDPNGDEGPIMKPWDELMADTQETLARIAAIDDALAQISASGRPLPVPPPNLSEEKTRVTQE